jgi:hypothetical protein
MVSAVQAFAQAAPGEHVIGWRLDPAQRARLLERFPARYPEPVADHVTLKSDVDAQASLPEETDCQIVGTADDAEGVQALVVSIAGTRRRPDGGTYHITWSLAPGRDARESNQVIGRGWQALAAPVAVRLIPSRFP